MRIGWRREEGTVVRGGCQGGGKGAWSRRWIGGIVEEVERGRRRGGEQGAQSSEEQVEKKSGGVLEIHVCCLRFSLSALENFPLSLSVQWTVQ